MICNYSEPAASILKAITANFLRLHCVTKKFIYFGYLAYYIYPFPGF